MAADIDDAPPYSPELGRQDTSSDFVRDAIVSNFKRFPNYVKDYYTGIDLKELRSGGLTFRYRSDTGDIYISKKIGAQQGADGSWSGGVEIHFSMHPEGSQTDNGAVHVKYKDYYIRINTYFPDRNGVYLVVSNPAHYLDIPEEEREAVISFTDDLLHQINYFLATLKKDNKLRPPQPQAMPPMSMPPPMPRLPPGAAEEPPAAPRHRPRGRRGRGRRPPGPNLGRWANMPGENDDDPDITFGIGGASPATSLALSPHLDNIIGKRNSRKKRKTKRNTEKKRKTKRNSIKKRKTKRNSIKKRKTKRNSRKKRKYV